MSLLWFRWISISILSTSHCLEQKAQILLSRRHSVLGPRSKYAVSESHLPHITKPKAQREWERHSGAISWRWAEALVPLLGCSFNQWPGEPPCPLPSAHEGPPMKGSPCGEAPHSFPVMELFWGVGDGPSGEWGLPILISQTPGECSSRSLLTSNSHPIFSSSSQLAHLVLKSGALILSPLPRAEIKRG